MIQAEFTTKGNLTVTNFLCVDQINGFGGDHINLSAGGDLHVNRIVNGVHHVNLSAAATSSTASAPSSSAAAGRSVP